MKVNKVNKKLLLSNQHLQLILIKIKIKSMPPKKQQQQNSTPYTPIYVLPLFLDTKNHKQSQAQRILRTKQINIKKCIDKQKIIQILKQKGLSQHLSPQGQIKQEGRKFVCQNIKTVLQQFTAEINKPIDPKKDAGKKDNKKDSKKEEIPGQQNKQPIIELSFDKKCNYFHFYFDFISTPDDLQLSIQNGLKVDIVILIEEKIKKGSKIPDYNLLSKTYQAEQLILKLNQTQISEESKNRILNENKSINNKQILKHLKKIKNKNSQFSHTVILEIPFQTNFSHPENDQINFINGLFENLCKITLQKQHYEKWIKNQVKIVPMIEPLKQIIRKEVVVQSLDKKAKKDANKQPEIQIVQQVIQTKYQSLAENIKSNLKVYKLIQNLRIKNTHDKSSLKQILQNTLFSVQSQIQNQKSKLTDKSDLNEKVYERIKRLKSKPLAKLNTLNNLKQNVRSIQSFLNSQLPYNLITQSKQIDSKVSLQQILHNDPTKKDTLEFQHVIKRVQEFIRSEQPKLKWDLSDRVYREKLNKNQILSEIQQEILKDPKILQGILNKDNIKLLCLAKINPPGRVLYSNDIFSPKILPDFQHWLENNHSEFKKPELQFFDYKFQEAGNLAIRRQKLCPTDNVLICDEKITCGSMSFKINNFQKDNTIYGLKHLDQSSSQFWLQNRKQNTRLSIFQKQHQLKKTSLITQTHKSQNQNSVENVIQSIQKQKRIQIWFRTQNFILANNPYPLIIWSDSNKRERQIRRQFGPKGQITSYLKDGSIKIFYLNGNVSVFRNNKWERVVDNRLSSHQHGREGKVLSIHEIIQGDKIIRIRQDQTTFIQFSNGNILTIFCDQTKVLFKKTQKIHQIITFNQQFKEQIIIRICQARNKDFNIIGHGSAFAYLGFKNILQRSYNGFLYQVWNNKISTHLYIQKYQYEHKLYEEQIRIIHLEDGSLIKIQGTGKLTYIQGDYSSSEDKLRQKWNQIFTTSDHHEVGVYDADLNQGSIKTKDSESNQFKINVDQQNQINIAVSFKISDQDKIKNNFGNGFHVPEQNFFLPSPQNSIPARIFSFDNESHSYYQYLTESQVQKMQLSNNHYHTEQTILQNKKVIQFTRSLKKEGSFRQQLNQISFSSAPLRQNFQISPILITKQTTVNLPIQNDNIQFRMLQKVDWSPLYQNINRIQETILTNKQKRDKQLKNFSS